MPRAKNKTKKTVKRTNKKCLTCGGSGFEEAEVVCLECKGKGKVK